MQNILRKDKAMKNYEYKLKKAFIYAFPAFVAMLLLLNVYALKHIYPFGNQNIIYSDFAQTTAATYYHLHDVVWEGKGFLFDFSVGLGASDYGFMTFNGLLSPLSWLTLLVPRSQILNFIPFLFMIKVGLMALTFNIFLNRFFKKKPDIFVSTALSVLYAMSGYTMLYTVIFQFLEAAILFPLILLGLKRVYEGKGFKLYTLTLALSTVCCYYTSIMIILFTLLSSPFAVAMFTPKNERKKAVASLAYGTVFSLLISAFVIVPTYIQISKSIRIGMFKFSNVLKSGALVSAEQKLAVLLPLSMFLSVFVAVIVRLISRRMPKEEKKFYLFAFFMIIISVLPAVFEPINLLWHTGKYVMFPYRYGFIAVAVILAVCGYFFGRLGSESENRKKSGESPLGLTLKPWQKTLTAAICILTSALFLWLAADTASTYANDVNRSSPFSFVSKETFSMIVKISLAFAVVFLPLMIAIKRQTVRFVLACVCLIQTFAFSYMYLGVPEDKIGRDGSTDYINTASEFSETVDFHGGDLGRVKDNTMSLNSNYPMVMQRSAISGWVHFISEDNQESLKALGYSSVYTRTLDSGGTVFSDSVLGITDIISSESLSPGFYTRSDTCNGLGIYANNYTLPFGVILKGESSLREGYDISGAVSPFKMQNDLYRDMTGRNEDIIKIYDVKPKEDHVSLTQKGEKLVCEVDPTGVEPSSISYSVKVKERQKLYLNISDCYGGQRLLRVEVNGSTVNAKSLSGSVGYYFPTTWDNGLIELGTFENETVTVSLFPDESNSYFYLRTLEIGGISEDNMKKLSAETERDYSYSVSGSRLSYQTSGKKGQMLMLPISYYDGFSAKVNGQKARIHKIYGNFIGIDLQDGDNDISVSFAPSGFKISIVISLFGALIFILCLHFRRIYGIMFNCWLKKAVYIVYWIVASAAVVFLYVVLPLMWKIANLISP